jgi:polyhydroxyalkanoate synthase
MLDWNPILKEKAEKLENTLREYESEPLREALRTHIAREWQAICEGALVSCRATQTEKPMLDAKLIWESGCAKLFDYAPEGGYPVVVIPSLINRAYILDLEKDHSFLRYLANNGLRPLLVEWSDPEENEYHFRPANYVLERLEPALDKVLQLCGNQKPCIIGHCVGGVLAIALTQRRQESIAVITKH